MACFLDLRRFQLSGVVLTLFWIVGVTNAFNLLDNMDGLSAGTACIAAFLPFFSWHHHRKYLNGNGGSGPLWSDARVSLVQFLPSKNIYG